MSNNTGKIKLFSIALYFFISTLYMCSNYNYQNLSGKTSRIIKFSKTVSSYIKVITKLPNSEQSYKGKVKTHNYINRQNQSTTGKL